MPTKLKSAVTPVGKIIRKVRIDKKISPTNFANATGLSIGYIKKIESGKVRPPVGTLLTIARALNIDSGTLIKAKAASIKNRVAAYTRRTENYAYTTLTPGAANNYLKAFRIMIDPKSKHQGVGYQHQGEEFIYVLRGQIEVDVGSHRNKLKQGESLLFNSNIRHKMRNPGDHPTELIVVIYTP
jgi:transcriptional regulator with XRE-family HTH domain